MSRTEPKIDRELLGRVASLTRGQQRWLRTILQSVVTMEPAAREPATRRPAEEERPRRAGPRRVEPESAEEPRRKDLDDLLSGEDVSAKDYPELAEELEGIGDIADLLREGGRERRRFGEEIMRLFEGSDADGNGEDDEEDENARLN
jgi:hypothetical protein